MKIKAILRSSKNPEDKLEAWFPGWFKERFGDHFAQISVDTTLKLKSSVKDVSRARRKRCDSCSSCFESTNHISKCPNCGNNRVPGYVPDDIEELCKLFILPPQGVSDYNFVMGYSTDEEEVPGSSVAGHKDTDEALLTYIERYPHDWAIVQKCLGLARQKSRHACAYVIANRPIGEFIPLTSVGGVQCTAFTASAVEGVGGLKMDFLVVNSLRDIQDCIRIGQSRSPNGIQTKDLYIDGKRVPPHRLIPDPKTNQLVDIWDLPEDQDVFRDVAEGRTETVFQFNTPGALQWLVHFNHDRADGLKAIKSIEDMAAFTALDRPGPLNMKVVNPDWSGPQEAPEASHNMLVEFARRARGATPSPGVLSVLDELVPETYGVMTYQEQLQRVYQAITGCSGSEAEQFRTNVSKKLFEKVAQAYGPFIERAGAKIGTENAQKLWDFIKTWAEYGFNKSHAVCYALIGYSCAWLKHHYPLEWWCSVLRNATKDEVNEKFWRYCGKHVSLPDIKLSQENWAIEQDRIRAPVSLLHGIGEKAHEQLCRSAPYATIDDFAEKLLQHRADGIRQVMKSKTNPKTKEKTEVPGWSLGRSSISRSAVYTLIVAGAMDSLFPQNAGVAECLEMYDEAIKTAATKRWEQETHPEKKAMWKSAWTSYRNAAKKTYQTLDPLARYQMRKSILPAYGSDLRAMFLYLPLPSCLSIVDGKKMRYSWKRWDRDARRMVDAEDPVIGAEKLDILNTTQNLPTHGYRCAVLAYLEEKRRFQYGDHKSKEAMELTLEVGGGKYRFVVWPKSDGSLPDNIKELKNGSVIAAILVRNRPDKPFSVKDLTVVRDALKANTAGETKENENEEET